MLVDGVQLDLSSLPRDQRRRIARAGGTRCQLAHLVRRLDRADEAAVRRLYAEAMNRLLRLTVPPEPDEPHKPGHAGRAWIRRLEQEGFEQLLLASPEQLVGTSSAYHLGVHRYDTIRAYLADADADADSYAFSRIENTLEHTVQRWQAIRDFRNEAQTWRPNPPAEPALAEMWENLRQTRQRLADEGEGGTLSRLWDERISYREDRDELVFYGLGQVDFTEDGLVLHTVGRHTRLDVIDATIDVLTHPHHAALAAQLNRVWSTPQYLRHLQQLVERTAPVHIDPDDDKPLLGWEVSQTGDHPLFIEAVQCRPAKRGGTFVTRRVGNLPDNHTLLADPRDRTVSRLGRSYDAEGMLQALRLLRGHPRVFYGAHSKKVPIQLEEVQLRVAVRQTEDGAVMRLEADGTEVSPEVLVASTFRAANLGEKDGVLRFAEVTTPLSRAQSLFDERGNIVFPDKDAVDALRRLLPVLSRQVPVDIDESLLGVPLQGEPRPMLVCSWQGGLTLDARIAPATDAIPSVPGQGSPVMFVERAGVVHHFQRNLDAEPSATRDALQPLGLTDSAEALPFSWSFTDPQKALSIIEKLQEHRTEFQLRWQGEPPRPPRTARMADLSLRVGSGVDWFGVSGSLASGRNQVSLATVMAAAARGHTYVPVGKDTWARLEDGLKQRLADLDAIQQNGQLGAFHGSLIEAIEEAGATVEAPATWRERQGAIRAARSLPVPVPADLQATLRPYQRDGFVWMARLASWSPGAVLADDMGLGKTIQTIALMLHRKGSGPALVVAPTSVVDNWAAELARFAPSLSVGLYRGPTRADLLTERPDVLLTSYGLLPRDIESLGAHEWGTVVLDEAQAIRNPDAQRSKAARALHAGFRLALSGTPVQNRTDELWALMAFALPGLLGSKGHFQRSFVVPIEHHQNAERRALLAGLVGPFVLRRTKQSVLSDLPPRTESTVRVVLSEPEQVAYDKARADAIVRLEQAGRSRSFQVLQELLRLRQLSCHPKLVDPDSTVAGSKLKAVVRTLVQLRAAGHKALVFSSFTSHLALVRHALDSLGFGVRYLDGSTSVRRRAEEVAAFQAGDGDVFLISLKAGGTGLNLTAASYVLHIDPWWNPAAEDQASDRAHRIGQDKAVTVYRFVSAGTIEEQIVSLHARKRELAEALLSASESTQHIDTDELMALIRAARAPDEAPVAAVDASREVAPVRPMLRLVHDADAVVQQTAPAREQAEAPPQPPVASAESADDLLQRFATALASELAGGTIHSKSTVRTYLRTATNLTTWARSEGYTTAREVLDHAHQYVALAKEGKGLSKSDRTVAGTVVRRLEALAE